MDTPIFEKKNVLVTGGAGFIGSHLCERLLKEANVICIDNFSNSNPANIEHLLQYPDFEFINHDVNLPFDLNNFDELDKFKVKFQGVQEIYHLACPTSPKEFEKLKMQSLLANSAAMINTLNLAVKYRAKYLFASSSVVYGPSKDGQKFSEEYQGVVNHLTPRSCYDEGKRFAETCVETYRQVYGVDAKVARIFPTYGPRTALFQGELVSDFIINALENKDVVVYGDEALSTTLCYITDMIDGLVRLMAAEVEIKVVNLGGDQIIKYSDVAQEIINLVGSTSQVKFEDPLLFLTKKGMADLSYVKNSLGWMPLVRLADGLQKTIDYISANKESFLYSYKK